MGSNGMIIIFVIIGIIIAVMIPIMIKKKRSERNKMLISARHNKDEVWKSIKQYLKDSFHILTKEEYVDIVCDQLEYLKDTIVINRITGDPIKEELVEPEWLIKKFGVLNEIDKEMKKRDSYQGIKYED